MSESDRSLLRALREVADVLVYTFDFELAREGETPAWFHVPGAHTTLVAVDSSSGAYAWTSSLGEGAAGRAVYVDVTLQIGVLGHSLREALALVVALPYFRELLPSARAGVALGELRDLARRFEAEVLEDVPALAPAREDLFGTLPIPRLIDPLARFAELNAKGAPHPDVRYASELSGWQPIEPAGPRASSNA